MIAWLEGIIVDTDTNHTIVNVGGIGHKVMCSSRTLAQLPTGQPVTLYIESHTRDDGTYLYGFLNKDERNAFQLLESVQGIGGKAALAILSVLSPDELIHAIAAQDKNAICRADGVGPKLGARVVNELKDKVSNLSLNITPTKHGDKIVTITGTRLTDDAISALINLGYARTQAFQAVSRAANELGTTATVEQLITTGLKELA